MIGFGNGSNDFQKLIARKSPLSHDADAEYIRQESESSTNFDVLSRISVHLTIDQEINNRKQQAAMSNTRSKLRQVTFEEAFAFAQLHGAIYAEVSASINLNLQIVFKEHMQHIFNTLKSAYMSGSSSLKRSASSQGSLQAQSAANQASLQR